MNSPTSSRTIRSLRAVAAVISVAIVVGLVGLAPANAAAGDNILIYGPSLASTSQNEQTIAEADGATVTVWDEVTWGEASSDDFAAFDAIVFGDPNCVTDPSILDTAVATSETWGSVVTGPKIVIGTDPIFHVNLGTAAAGTLTANAIDFAASGTGTGLYASLSCYYFAASAPTAVPLLAPFGTFEVLGQDFEAEDAVTIIDGSHPSMAGLTSTSLSNWGNSVHEVFDAYPGSFSEIVRDNASEKPYIIATGGSEPPVEHTLSVDVVGDGSGNVESDPAGISCPGIEGPCSNQFDDGTEVTLTATADEGSDFTTWGGDCAFAGTNPICTLTMDGDKTATAQFDPESAAQADLSISKSDEAPFGPDPVSSGGTVAYVVSVSNAGPDAATGVNVVDTPEGGTLTSASGSGWTCSIEGNTASCDLAGSLASGADAADLLIQVDAPTTETDAEISDTATVSGAESDPVPGNNSDTETTGVTGSTNTETMDHAATFYDGTQEVTLETTRDPASGFYSQLIIPPGLNPGVVTIDEFPTDGSEPVPGVTNPGTFCGGSACVGQFQVTVLPGGQTSAENPIKVIWIYTDGTGGNKLYVKGDGETVAEEVKDCKVAGVANPAKCRDSITRLPNKDREYVMLWRDGGDPVGAKRG